MQKKVNWLVFLLIPVILSFISISSIKIDFLEFDHEDNEIEIDNDIFPKLSVAASDFKYNKTITIDNTKVNGSSNHINFPLFLSLYDSDLRYEVQLDGDDLAFSNGTEWLDHEIELFNQTYNETHAQLIAWVRIPSLSPSIDTNITMYFGNSSMSRQENPSGVWDSNYKGVWHLKENPSDSPPQFQDSTINYNNGTEYNLTSANQVEGKIDGSLVFDDFNERCVNVSHHNSLQLATDMTISAWVMTTNTDGNVNLIINKWGTPTNRNYWLGKLDANTLAFFVDAGQSVTTNLNLINDGSWHYVVVVADESNSLLRIYIDGIQRNTNAYSGSSETGTSVLNIGRGSGSIQQEWDGGIDEARVSNIDRSADWIATEFNNQNDSNSFYSVGIISPPAEPDVSPPVEPEPDLSYIYFYFGFIVIVIAGIFVSIKFNNVFDKHDKRLKAHV